MCRQVIYYNPEQAKLAIVVVGRLCPGVNDIIRSIVSKARKAEGGLPGYQTDWAGTVPYICAYSVPPETAELSQDQTCVGSVRRTARPSSY